MLAKFTKHSYARSRSGSTVSIRMIRCNDNRSFRIFSRSWSTITRHRFS